MSENKENFSAGHWRIIGRRIMSAEHNCFGGNTCVCRVHEQTSESKEIANAHLISTAPELYSVLKEWVDYKTDGGVDALFELEILKSMKKVLKKARGEE